MTLPTPVHPFPRSGIDLTPFLARLRQMLEQFSPTEKKLALEILDTPIHLGSYSASELAEITGISNATITRFVRRLGYPSYEHARRQARLEADAAGKLPLPPAAQASANAPNSQALWQEVQTKLHASLMQIPASTMDNLAAALHRAPRVLCLGLGANHLLAQHMVWLLQEGLDKHCQAGPAAGQTVAQACTVLGRGDMLVLFALGGIDELLLPLCEAMRQAGIHLLCMTDSTSPAPTSDWLLRCQHRPHAPVLEVLTDTSAAHSMVYGLVAHAVQWGAKPFELE